MHLCLSALKVSFGRRSMWSSAAFRLIPSSDIAQSGGALVRPLVGPAFSMAMRAAPGGAGALALIAGGCALGAGVDRLRGAVVASSASWAIRLAASTWRW